MTSRRRSNVHGFVAVIRERWYLWFVVAAVCFGVGLLVVMLGESGALGECTNPDTCATGTAVWAGWLLSWLAAATAGVVGMATGFARFVERRRP